MILIPFISAASTLWCASGDGESAHGWARACGQKAKALAANWKATRADSFMLALMAVKAAAGAG